MITIAVVNQSTVLTDAQVAAVIPAMQTQVSRDFVPWWITDAIVTFFPANSVPPGSLVLAVCDDSDQAGALGYHEIGKSGVPDGFVFAKTDLQAGLSWTVTFSHELLELLADPFVFSVVIHDNNRGGLLGAGGSMLALEVADACEDDSLGYLIDGVKVSDFVTPAWFGGPGSQFSFMGHCTAPYQILPGGYIGVRQFRGAGQWGQVQAAMAPDADKWQIMTCEQTNGPMRRMAVHEIPKLSRRWKRMQQTEPS